MLRLSTCIIHRRWLFAGLVALAGMAHGRCGAQQLHGVRWGGCAVAGAHAQLLPIGGVSRYGWFGGTGVYGMVVVPPASAVGVWLAPRVGLALHPVAYELAQGLTFTYTTVYADINPEAWFPLAGEQLFLNAGFGLKLRFANNASEHGTNSSGTISAQSFNDAFDAIKLRLRKVIPYLSGGITRAGLFGRKELVGQIFLRQDCLRTLDEDALITYNLAGGSKKLDVNFQPISLSVAIIYLLGGNKAR